MRLIDADELKKYISKMPLTNASKEMFKNAIKAQPAAYDVDKVVEEIEENGICVGIDSIDCPVKYCGDCEENVISIKKATDIINKYIKQKGVEE